MSTTITGDISTWRDERHLMKLRLVTADAPTDVFSIPDRAPATGVIVGVFCGSMFWLGLVMGWAFWG